MDAMATILLLFHVERSCVTPLPFLEKIVLEAYLCEGRRSVPRGTVLPTLPELLTVLSLVRPGD